LHREHAHLTGPKSGGKINLRHHVSQKPRSARLLASGRRDVRGSQLTAQSSGP
jgi:hypothetical protein